MARERKVTQSIYIHFRKVSAVAQVVSAKPSYGDDHLRYHIHMERPVRGTRE